MEKANNNVDKFHEPFPSRLRDLMSDKQKPVSRQELANELGISPQQVSNYTVGTSLPDYKSLYKIAKFFNVSADYLLGITEVKNSNIDDQKINKQLGLSEKVIKLLRTEVKQLCELTNCDSFEAAFEKFITFKIELNERDCNGIIKSAQKNGFNVNTSTKELILSDIPLFCATINELAEYPAVYRYLWDILFLDTSKTYQVREVLQNIDSKTTIPLDNTPAYYLFDRSYLRGKDLFAIKMLNLSQALNKRLQEIDGFDDEDGEQ